MKVILVGNGPSLLSSGLGSLIDSYDVVVRMNNFRTSGFESDVGSKTDVWVTTLFHDVQRSLIQTEGLSEVILAVNHFPMKDGWFGAFRWLCDSTWRSGPRVTTTHPDQVRSYNRSMGSHRPSTGIMACLAFLDRCASIAVAGFDHFSNTSGHHYFGLADKRPQGCPHNGQVEKKWLELQVEQGRIKMP